MSIPTNDQELLDYLFQERNIPRIESLIDETNEISESLSQINWGGFDLKDEKGFTLDDFVNVNEEEMRLSSNFASQFKNSQNTSPQPGSVFMPSPKKKGLSKVKNIAIHAIFLLKTFLVNKYKPIILSVEIPIEPVAPSIEIFFFHLF